MAGDKYGYRHGPRVPVAFLVDSSTPAAIEVGDMVSLVSAGYIGQAAAGDIPMGVAMDRSAVPSADGDIKILVDISREAVYEYPPDTGSVTQALVGLTCDVGGARSINIDASTDDVIEIVGADVTNNSVFIRLRPTYSGVE